METVREIHEDILTTSIVEYHEVDFWFPPYLDASTPFVLYTTGDTNAIFPNVRSDVQAKVPCKFTTTFHAAPQTPGTIYQFLPVDFDFTFTNGLSVRATNVITDGGTLNIRVPDPTTSTITLQVTFPASSPTTTEYLADVGTTELINDDSTKWKFNLWKRVQVEMTIPDFSLILNGNATE
jgi:hypothetical protein